MSRGRQREQNSQAQGGGRRSGRRGGAVSASEKGPPTARRRERGHAGAAGRAGAGRSGGCPGAGAGRSGAGPGDRRRGPPERVRAERRAVAHAGEGPSDRGKDRLGIEGGRWEVKEREGREGGLLIKREDAEMGRASVKAGALTTSCVPQHERKVDEARPNCFRHKEGGGRRAPPALDVPPLAIPPWLADGCR